jgi:ABC-type Na+ efflux pump permease subunit
MQNNLYKAIIKKDLKTVFSDRLIYLPFVLIPLIFCLLLPIGIYIGTMFSETMKDDFNSIPFPDIKDTFTEKDKLIAFALGFMFPPLFLIIPIFSGSIIAGTGFIGEKENKTIESLLYTNVTIGQLFKAKILSAFIPSLIVTFISFALFLIVNILGIYIVGSQYEFPFLKWSVLVLWLCPVITLLAIFMMVLVSAKAKSFQEAQQRTVFIILPIIFLIIGQVSGLFYLNTLIIFMIGLFILIINYFLFKAAINSYTPEKLVA